MDVNYCKSILQMPNDFAYPIVKLETVIAKIQYGISKLATETPSDTPIIRMNNITDDGWDLSDLKYVTLSDEEFQTYRVEAGDILFNRTNSKELVGKCEVFKETGDWVFASYLIRIGLDKTRAIPEYVVAYLTSVTGRKMIDGVSRQIIGMSNINANEIKNLDIPLPPLDVQKTLVADLEKARAERKAKLATADELLKGMDAVVMHELGLELPQENKQSLVFAVKVGNMQKRWDVHYQQPHFQKITSIARTVPNVELGNLVEISHETVDPKTFSATTFQYIEISGVDLHTGEITLSEELTSEPPSRARMLVREHDILVSLTRPHRGAITLLDKQFDQCVASTGFAVLRQLKNEQVKREYLLCVLRTRLGLGQLERGSSGGSYPAITEDEMAQILIPVPSIQIQERIIAELQNRRERARQLRLEADALWQAAQQRFENALIQQPENSKLITEN